MRWKRGKAEAVTMEGRGKERHTWILTDGGPSMANVDVLIFAFPIITSIHQNPTKLAELEERPPGSAIIASEFRTSTRFFEKSFGDVVCPRIVSGVRV